MNKEESGKMNLVAYVVEARVSHVLHSRPVMLHDGVLTEQWRNRLKVKEDEND